MSKLEIDNRFSKLNPSAWKQMIQFQLEGEDYAQQMIFHSLEGIDIKPFYTEEDLNQSIDFAKRDWSIEESIAVYQDVEANKLALEAIDLGAESIHFKVFTPNCNFNLLVEGIDLNTIKVHLCLQQLSEELIDRIVSSQLKQVVFSIDPLSKFYVTGNWYLNQKSDLKLLTTFLELIEQGFQPSLELDNYSIAEAGANNVYQIAMVLAHLAEYLHYFEAENKLHLLKRVTIKLGVGTHFFFEIAKVRALRLLIPSLLEAFDVEISYDLSSKTSSRYYTAYNSVQNLVRSSNSLLSSVLSTADTVSGIAHDSLIYNSNKSSNRLIRNQLLLLKNEAGLNEHQDAANGSYYINYLTEQFSQKALGIFKLIEKNQGLLFQLKNGSIQKEIEKQHLKELELYKANKEVLIGATAFKDKRERLKKVAERKPFLVKKSRKTAIIPIVKRRIASYWEEKRWNHE